jgi:hypothetical protein
MRSLSSIARLLHVSSQPFLRDKPYFYPMRNQPEPQKPEWFELLDGDAPSAQVAKVDKKLPIIGALVIGAALVSGSLFASANGGGEQSAVAATNQVENATDATMQSVAGATSGALQSPGDSITQDGSIQNPSVGGVKPPRGGDHEDDDEDEDEDEDEDDDDRRDHRDRDEH